MPEDRPWLRFYGKVPATLAYPGVIAQIVSKLLRSQRPCALVGVPTPLGALARGQGGLSRVRTPTRREGEELT